MWIGTVGAGVNKMIPLNSGFKNFNLVKENEGTKPGTYIMGFQQLSNEIWFNNIWDQIGMVNLKTGQTT